MKSCLSEWKRNQKASKTFKWKVSFSVGKRSKFEEFFLRCQRPVRPKHLFSAKIRASVMMVFEM